MNTINSPAPRIPWWIGGAVLYVALLAIAPWADANIARTLRADPLPGDLEKLILLAEVFAHGLGVAAILLTVKFLDPRGWRVIPRLATTAYLSGVVANVLKMMVIRRRPNHLEEIPAEFSASFEGFLAPLTQPWSEAFDYSTQSFPSAHTATAFGLAVGLGHLYPRGARLFFVFAMLAGLQRMIVQAHFLSDVLVGAGIGMITAHFLQRPAAWTERLWSKWESVGPTSSAETLSTAASVDTLKGSDGGNVQEPGGGKHVDTSIVDSERRRAG